jgi:Ca2+/Na+ antiporter
VNVILLFCITLAVFLVCKTKREMSRPLGIACIAAYAAYTVYLVMMV